MKLLLVGEFSKGSLCSSYFNSFCKLGIDCSIFDYKDELSTSSPLFFSSVVDRFFAPFFYRVINVKLFEKVSRLKPDLILVFKGIFIFPKTLLKIKIMHKCLLFNFNPDNPFNKFTGASNELIRNSIPCYDCYFIWGKFLIPELEKAGAKHVKYLPFAYDAELHFPLKVSSEDMKIYGSDIAFIGSWDKEREEFLLNLKDYDLAIWGNSWEKLGLGSPLKKKWKRKDVIGEEFSKVCNSSKIVLNHIRKQNVSAHNMKTFEIPACEGLMVTQKTKEQAEFFDEGSEVVFFDNIGDLKEKLQFYLTDDDKRKSIAKNANVKIKNHTYENRAEAIVGIYLSLKSKGVT